MSKVDVRDCDRQIWEEELADFVPQRVFDAHCHLMDSAHVPTQATSPLGRTDNDLACLQAWSSAIYPGREVHYLVLGTPVIGIDVAAHNRWVQKEISTDPLTRFNRLVTPACKLADIERDLKANPQIVGLKCYRIFSVTGDVNQCRIHEFLPHEQMELANEHGVWVTMHLSRFAGCADKQNLDDLEEYTVRRYPNIRWILAHCARSFTYYPIRQAIDRLRNMPNIWYDLSGVTDMRPHLTLFQKEDHRRIFFGSDGVTATFFHGSYLALGRAWQYLDLDKHDMRFAHTNFRPILCIYQQLLDMKHAAEVAGLSREQIDDIFWNNAVQALGVEAPETAGARR